MQLVIAEKPSVAGDLARVLPGKFEAKEGYWEGPEHLISWAVGHLLELAEPEDYDPELKKTIVGRCGFLAKIITPGEMKPGETIAVERGVGDADAAAPTSTASTTETQASV